MNYSFNNLQSNGDLQRLLSQKGKQEAAALPLDSQNGLGCQRSTSVSQDGVGTTVDDSVLLSVLQVLISGEGSEAPEVADNDVLTARELILGTSQSLHNCLLICLLRTHGENDLSDVHTSHGAGGLAEGLTHTRLQSICSCARQHLVDTENVEGVSTDTHVEGILSSKFGHILVHDDTTSLQRFTGKLLILSGHKVNTQREGLSGSRLVSDVVDLNLGVRHTAAESRLDVRLVLAIAVAFGRAASHGVGCCGWM